MDLNTLVNVFDGAQGVVVHDSVGLISVWNGSATVNVYDLDGRTVDCWTDYDLAGNGSDGGWRFRLAAIDHVDTTVRERMNGGDDGAS